MDANGERYLPPMGLQMSLEHWHRYLLAARMAEGVDVLDVACGEGYGSAFLSRHARSVVGVDISQEAIAGARTSYRAENLRFEQASAGALPLPDHCVDLIVSFETIEHVDKEIQDAFFREARRVLRPGGKLVISTPDKAVYSTARNYQNPYHTREYERDEFVSTLHESFRCVQVAEQRAALFSLIVDRPLEVTYGVRKGLDGSFAPGAGKLTYEYLIAVCSDADTGGADLNTSVAFDESILVEQYDSTTRALVDAMATAEERGNVIRDLTAQNQIERTQRSQELQDALSLVEERGAEIGRLCEQLLQQQALATERAQQLESSAHQLLQTSALAEERAVLLRDQTLALDRAEAALARSNAGAQLLEASPRTAEVGPRRPVSPEPLVSVVVPSYNHGHFIAGAIDSALGQTHGNVEVIVIDDGSTDESAEFLAKRYGRDSRVRLHARENRGAHATINQAIGMAKGEFVTILNSDDLYEPARLEKLIASARESGGHPFFGITGLRVVDHTGEPSVSSNPLSYYGSVMDKFEGQPDIASFWVGNLAMTTSNFFFSRDVFDKVGPFSPLRYTHDWDWALRASECVNVHRLPDVLLHYRVHGTNTISEGNLWKHVAENAYVFASALKRTGLTGLAERGGVSPLDALRALLRNESFAPLPVMSLLALGLTPEKMTEMLASGAIEKWMATVVGSKPRDIDLMMSVDHVRKRIGGLAVKPAPRLVLPTDKGLTLEQRVRAMRKAGARVRKRLLRRLTAS